MSFFSELRRRNIFKVAIAYSSAAWLLLLIAEAVLENFNLPGWFMTVFHIGLAVGFPVAIIVAWLFEVTPNGVKLQKNVAQGQSITRQTGHQLNRGIVMILSVAIVFLFTQSFRDEIFSNPGASLKNARNNQNNCNIVEAARSYENAIAENPENSTAHHQYATLLYMTGRTVLALEHLQAAKAIDPSISALIAEGNEDSTLARDDNQSENWYHTVSGPDKPADEQCVIPDGSVWSVSFREQRKTAEFFHIMEQAGIVEYWREFGWPDDCASLNQSLAECPTHGGSE